MFAVLVIAAVVLFGYSVYVQYGKQPTDSSFPAKVWAAVLGAGAAIGAAVHMLFSSGS